ncbi:hypothetical protein C8J56DRAFT_895860 [Mycena floridula]|nr:hypothetical protein C8J56DRAFT_895860 [Mycena floridula]
MVVDRPNVEKPKPRKKAEQNPDAEEDIKELVAMLTPFAVHLKNLRVDREREEQATIKAKLELELQETINVKMRAAQLEEEKALFKNQQDLFGSLESDPKKLERKMEAMRIHNEGLKLTIRKQELELELRQDLAEEAAKT